MVYWVNIANGLKIVVLVGVIIGIIACIPLIIAVIDEDGDYLKPLRIVITCTVVCIIAAVFIPTKNTLIEMKIAKYATLENAEWTVDAIKDLVDYITNAIK